MALETNQFSAPKEITVSISVTNVGESDMPGPVTLYYPSGKQVEEFGSPHPFCRDHQVLVRKVEGHPG